MGNGKAKGSSWERQIAKDLTFWLTGQNKEYYFWRSPASGGLGTISPINTELYGDIIPLKDDAYLITEKIVIECKTGYSQVSLDNHLKNNKSDKLKDFWNQVLNSSKNTLKYPILIYKKKGMSTTWIGINDSLYNKLKKHLGDIRYIKLFFNEKEVDILFLFSYKLFFEKITPDIIKKL